MSQALLFYICLTFERMVHYLLFWDIFSCIFFKRGGDFSSRGNLPTLLLPLGDIFHHLPPVPRQEPAWLSEEWPRYLVQLRKLKGGLVWWFSLGPLASFSPGGTDRLGDKEF